MKIKDVEFENNVFLAPMAGIADRAFRELCINYGAGYTVSEMVSSKGLTMGDKKSGELLTLGEIENPAGVQIFGDNPEIMAQAAKMCIKYHPNIIDINMGCPAPKIAMNGGGASLMKNPLLAGEIIKAVSKAVDIPVIANGDIVDEQSAAIMFEKTNCDAIMIGRGALGNPWIFRRINAYLNECRVLPDVSINEKMVVMLKHIQKIIEYKGEYTAMREARHHAAYYTKGIRGGAALRKEISTFEHFEQLEELAYKIAKENE